MKKHLFTLALCFGCIAMHAQVLLMEGFENGNLPVGWTQLTNATDNGWKVGTSTGLSSQYWPIAPNGSARIAATNDDGCNCDKSNDYLILPLLNFTGLTGIALTADVFFGKVAYLALTMRCDRGDK